MRLSRVRYVRGFFVAGLYTDKGFGSIGADRDGGARPAGGREVRSEVDLRIRTVARVLNICCSLIDLSSHPQGRLSGYFCQQG